MSDVPKSVIGYAVVNADWTPPKRTSQSWILPLPLMFVGIKDAEAAQAGFRAMAPEEPDKMIIEATIAFRVVQGRGRVDRDGKS